MKVTAASTPEPDPQPGRTRVLDFVMQDLQARAEMGCAKYGTYLMTHNGRDALMDAYQEALDLVMYLRQALEERVDRERREGVRPKIVCLCGSTRFREAYQRANLHETLAGRIVLSIGCDMRRDAELFAQLSDQERLTVKEKLDELHLWKINLADEVLVLNVGGYIGESTRREIAYARANGKRVRWLEADKEREDAQD